MPIRVAEVGKLFEAGAFFDLSGNTSMEIRLKDPDGVITTIPTGRITAPGVASGDFPADTYMQFTTLATDFLKAGAWEVCTIYDDATPKEFFSATGTFEILEGCF